MAAQDRMKTALLTAIEHSPEPMVISDARLPDMPMIAVNAAFETLSGYKADELVGRNCRLLQGPDTDPATRARIGRSLQAGQGCIEWIVNHRRDGTAFWNLLFLSPILDHDGALRYYLGNQLDITTGLPEWLGEVTFGRARMSPEVQDEFQTMLREILRNTPSETSNPAAALLKIIVAARRMAELSTQLEPAPALPPGGPRLPAAIRPAARAVPAGSAPGGPAGS